MSEKDTKSVLLLSAINPTRAYSGVIYMYETLVNKNYDVEIWSVVPEKQMGIYRHMGKKAYSFLEKPWGRIPKVRMLYILLKGFFLCMKYRKKVIICHDLFHYRSCVLIKKLFPETSVVLYCNEIYNEKSIKFQQKLMAYYEKNANVPDYMIECEELRRMYRVNKYHLDMPSSTILNTIPIKEIENIVSSQKKKNIIPVIVYSGGIHTIGEWNIIIDALAELEDDFCAELYCYGNKAAIVDLHKKCREKLENKKYKIVEGLGREEVLKRIYNADIGIVYYDPNWSINTRYAAPTKFFEYISLGLPVVSSGNESLINLINEYELGVIMESNDSSGMQEALHVLVSDEMKRKRISNNARNAFKEKLCYEQQSTEAFEILDNIIKGTT